MKKYFIGFCFFALSATVVYGENNTDSAKIIQDRMLAYLLYSDSVNKAMQYETGIIQLKGGMASLNVPKGFKYLGIEQSNFVLTDVWGNPKRDDILGMLFPENGSPFADSSYAFIISFDEMGYVKDDDASKINYQEMLDEMHKDEAAINAERQKLGYAGIHMVGWAQPPFYDANNKILHWAKELQFGDEEESTLNYDVRILGRKGILSLNAVATMNELNLVKNDIDKILSIATFTEGNRYSDFNNNTDKIAAYTVGGLVAGKVLLKIGFFAKFWKLIVLAFAAIGGWLVKYFKKKKEQEYVYEPTVRPNEEETTTE